MRISVFVLNRGIRLFSIIFLVVSGFALVSPQAKATAATGWTSTAPMNSSRAGHTASLLEDGRVLVVGGATSQSILSSAEIYDPQSGLWTPTTSLSAPREAHAAVMLSDGRVLVAGGYNNGALSSAMIYDPSAASWIPTGSMNMGRDSFAMVSLGSGRVLAVGGFNSNGQPLDTCEIYDPAHGTWTFTGALHTPRGGLNIQNLVVKLTDGRVLIEGGLNPVTFADLTSAEIYDPQTGTWSLTGSMNIARGVQSAALLPSGKVIVAGGDFPPTEPSTSEIYDPSTGRWTMAAPMTIFRADGTATPLVDGRVLVVGPEGPSTEIFDEATGTWTGSGSLTLTTEGHTATLLQDGRVLVAGGGFNGVIYSQAELFTPGPRTGLKVSVFFTDPSFNPLPLDTLRNPAVNVTLARELVRSTNPGQVLAWINVTNVSGSSVSSLKLNETLPVDWQVSPSWMPGAGAVHVYYADTTSPATGPEITQLSTITVTTGNPASVQLAIPSLNATAIGHPLLPGQSILLSVKLTYGLIRTSQSFTSYPRNYTDTASAAAWTLPSYTGTEASATNSVFFTAYSKIVGSELVSFGILTVRPMLFEKYWIQ